MLMMIKKVLLTGSRGMLGSALANMFIDFKLIALTHAELDITDRAAVLKYIGETRPDVIVNAAAYTAVDLAESESEKAFALNRDAVGNLIEAANNIDALLVHFSTDYVFDGKNATGYDEAATDFAPLNVYGQSKRAGEELIEHTAKRFMLIRTSWLFGPHGKNFVDTMLRLGHERAKLNIVADQHGCPTYTVDLAYATRELIEAGKTGIFHLTNSEPTTWADFAIEIFRQAQLPTTVAKIPSSAYPTPARRPVHSVLLNTRRPQLRKWKEALTDYLARPR